MQRGAVQVGDPFMEKLVCEACLELLATGAVAGIQDMGAAGLTCSTCETAARAGTGIEIELSKVPQRAPGMTRYEIMLSESQERMLIIVQAGREEEVKRIFDKWDLPWAQIGSVTDTGRMVVRSGGRVVVDIPAKKLADEAPVYQPESREPAYLRAVRDFTLAGVPEPGTPPRRWPIACLAHHCFQELGLSRVRPHGARRLVVCPGSDAAVIRIKEDSLPAGAAADSAPRGKIHRHDRGWQRRPMFIWTPTKGPRSPWPKRRAIWPVPARRPGRDGQSQFRQPAQPGTVLAAQGIRARPGDACRAFQTPVTGGNCSLYNQSPNGPIDPTPSSLSSGLIEKPNTSPPNGSRTKGTYHPAWRYR